MLKDQPGRLSQLSRFTAERAGAQVVPDLFSSWYEPAIALLWAGFTKPHSLCPKQVSSSATVLPWLPCSLGGLIDNTLPNTINYEIFAPSFPWGGNQFSTCYCAVWHTWTLNGLLIFVFSLKESVMHTSWKPREAVKIPLTGNFQAQQQSRTQRVEIKFKLSDLVKWDFSDLVWLVNTHNLNLSIKSHSVLSAPSVATLQEYIFNH